MRRVELKHISIRPRNPFAGWQHKLHPVVVGLFILAVLMVWGGLLSRTGSFHARRWSDVLLLLLTTATTLLSLSRQLPTQNVVLAATVIGLFGAGAEILTGLTAVPFGPLVYNEQTIGKYIFYPLPWSTPLIWIVVILNSRGVARLILRPWRRTAYYGFWVIGLTVIIVLLFDFAFEPYATQVREYWSWKPTKILSDWYGTPWVNFLGWLVTTMLLLLFVTPALINKSPNPPPQPSFHPLLVWAALNLVFFTGLQARHFWGACSVSLGGTLLVGTLSLCGLKGRGPAAKQKS